MIYLLCAACILAVLVTVVLANILAAAIGLYRQELQIAREIAEASKRKGGVI